MILRVEMDAFCASIEQRDRPEPAGVHGAMPSGTARRNCPRAVFPPPRIDETRERMTIDD